MRSAFARVGCAVLVWVAVTPAWATSEPPSHARGSDPGRLDPAFGQAGVVVTNLGGFDAGRAIAVGTRIVVAGTISPSNAGLISRDMALVGYRLDGTLDPSFGDAGVVIADFDEIDTPVGVRLDDEGRILALVSVGDNTDTRGTAVARYLPDGTPDASFGDGGVVDVGTDLYPSDLVLQADGRIVVAARDPIVLSRYLPDGQPDPHFGQSGRVVTSLGTPNDWPIALTALANGKLLMIARTAFLLNEDEGEFNLALLKYRRDGSLDRSFGEEGLVRRHIPDWYDVVDGGTDANGRIVALVSAWGGSSFCAASYPRQTLYRFRPNGRLDTSFDGDGRARVTTLNSRALALLQRGRILVVGEGCPDLDDPEMDLGFSLASYRANGSLDARFGSDGVVVNLVAGQFATPSSMAVQSSHRVLVVGGTVASAFDPLDVAVARFLI